MRRQMILSTLGLALIGAASVSATPQPQPISEGLQHGQQITIQGSGFGSKSQAAPLQWDNFEDGTPGADIPSGHNGWYLTRSSQYAQSTIYPLWSNEVQRISGGISVKQGGFPNGTSHAPEFALSHTLPVGGEIYISAWFWGTSNGPSRSNKWMHYANDWSRPVIGTTGGGASNYFRSTIRNCPDGGHIVPEDGVPHPYNNGWHHWEWYIRRSADGVFQCFYDGELVSEGLGDLTLDACPINRLQFNGYWGHWPDNDTISWSSYWDEIYIDITRSRVLIGNNSDYNSCNHTEIQIPTAWNPNSISFTVNKGSFSDGTAYLYVIDQDGSVNQNGIQVTLGGGGGGVDNPPGIQILTPVPGGEDYPIPDSVGTLVITGTANDDHGIAEITWSNDRTSESGPVSNESGNWRNWQLQGIGLETGVNTIEIRVRDSSNQTTTGTITVTRDWEYPGKPETPIIP